MDIPTYLFLVSLLPYSRSIFSFIAIQTLHHQDKVAAQDASLHTVAAHGLPDM